MAVEGEGVGGMGDAEEPGASYRDLALFLDTSQHRARRYGNGTCVMILTLTAQTSHETHIVTPSSPSSFSPFRFPDC